MSSSKISNSSRTSFHNCPYNYFLEYIRRLEPRKEAIYFLWGEIIHDCTAALEQGLELEEAIETLRQKMEQQNLTSEQFEAYEQLLVLAPNVIDAHMLKYHEQDKRYESLGGEKSGGEFELPLPCGWVFRGRIDKFVRDTKTGELIVWERKTTAQTGDSFWDSIPLDSQPKGYLLAGQRYFGYNTTSVIYDVWKKPQIKQKIGETREQFTQRLGEVYLLKRDKYFERRQVQFSQTAIDEHFHEVDFSARMIQHCMEEGIWPKYHPRNRKGGCAYKAICHCGEYSEMEEQQYHRRDRTTSKLEEGNDTTESENDNESESEE